MTLGLLLGPWIAGASLFGELGKLIIQLIKVVATPLLFLVIVRGVVTADIQARSGLRLLGWATLNSAMAMSIGLMVANVLQPGRHLSALLEGHTKTPVSDKTLNGLDVLRGVVPSSIVAPFAENNVLTVILLALAVGFALRRVRQSDVGPASQVVDFLGAWLRVTEIILGWALQLIPFAVFAVVVKSVSEHGFAPLRGLAMYVLAGLLGLGLHIALVYQTWLVVFAKRSLREFWRSAKEPVIYALGTNSSLATLPVTLKALERLGVSPAASTLGACVATNFNNDGIILYEGMAVLFVAQSAGIDLSLGQQIAVAATSLVAAMGVAGIPEAGFISLALVLNTVGLPSEILPLLLTVDWIIARARSVTNVLSDMMLSILIDNPRHH